MNARWAAGLLLAAVVAAAPPIHAQVPAATTPAPEAPMPAELDGLAWTVVRTPPNQRVTLPVIERGRNLLTGNIRPMPARRVPGVFWYANGGLRYGLVFQNRPAPLMVLIPGTGSNFDSVTSQQAHGSSTPPACTSWACRRRPTRTSSSTPRRRGVPGGRGAMPPTSTASSRWRSTSSGTRRGDHRRSTVAGYSLGALNAAWLASRTTPRSGRVQRVLLLNPPVSVWNSMQILDAMFSRRVPADPEGERN